VQFAHALNHKTEYVLKSTTTLVSSVWYFTWSD